MPHISPEEEKVIINGGVGARVLDIICDRLYDYFNEADNPTLPDVPKLVKMLNKIEDAVFDLEREFLDQRGFTGPYPRAIDIKPHQSSP